MRQFTDNERDFLLAYWFAEPLNNNSVLPERFEEGFIAGLDYRQADTEALQSLLDKTFETLHTIAAISERREQMNSDLIILNSQLETENDALRDELLPMLSTFDRDLTEGTIGRMVCDAARKALL